MAEGFRCCGLVVSAFLTVSRASALCVWCMEKKKKKKADGSDEKNSLPASAISVGDPFIHGAVNFMENFLSHFYHICIAWRGFLTRERERDRNRLFASHVTG